jgi:hypothetical protein
MDMKAMFGFSMQPEEEEPEGEGGEWRALARGQVARGAQRVIFYTYTVGAEGGAMVSSCSSSI